MTIFFYGHTDVSFRKDTFRISEERMAKIKALNEQTDVYEQLAAGLGKENDFGTF